jgi:cell division protein FtsW (lipid II flippase)
MKQSPKWYTNKIVYHIGSSNITSVKILLPDCHTDFVFSVLAEEFGLIMCLATLILFGIISARLLYVAYRESELFNHYMAAKHGQ